MIIETVNNQIRLNQTYIITPHYIKIDITGNSIKPAFCDVNFLMFLHHPTKTTILYTLCRLIIILSISTYYDYCYYNLDNIFTISL